MSIWVRFGIAVALQSALLACVLVVLLALGQ